MANSLDRNGGALQDRVVSILKDPKTEWPVIEAEATTTEQLYRSYIAPLAAIPPIAAFIGSSIVGMTVPFVGTYRVPILTGMAHALLSWVFALIGVYVAALIINKLAPTFESAPSEIQSLKLVGYAYTAAWLAGVFMVIPAFGVLAVLGGLYSIYLFYVGLPVMMKTPEARVLPYMAVAAIVVILVSILLGLVTVAITGVGMAGAYRY